MAQFHARREKEGPEGSHRQLAKSQLLNLMNYIIKLCRPLSALYWRKLRLLFSRLGVWACVGGVVQECGLGNSVELWTVNSVGASDMSTIASMILLVSLEVRASLLVMVCKNRGRVLRKIDYWRAIRDPWN